MPYERVAVELSCAGTGVGASGTQMRVLVTGAAGFIGAAAAMQLYSRGHGAGCLNSKPQTRLETEPRSSVRFVAPGALEATRL